MNAADPYDTTQDDIGPAMYPHSARKFADIPAIMNLRGVFPPWYSHPVIHALLAAGVFLFLAGYVSKRR